MDFEKIFGEVDRLLDVTPYKILQWSCGNTDAGDFDAVLNILLAPIIFGSFCCNVANESTVRSYFHEFTSEHIGFFAATFHRFCARSLELFLRHVEQHIIDDRRNPHRDPLFFRTFRVTSWFLADEVVTIRNENASILLRTQHSADRCLSPFCTLCTVISLPLQNTKAIQFMDDPRSIFVALHEPFKYLSDDLRLIRYQSQLLPLATGIRDIFVAIVDSTAGVVTGKRGSLSAFLCSHFDISSLKLSECTENLENELSNNTGEIEVFLHRSKTDTVLVELLEETE